MIYEFHGSEGKEFSCTGDFWCACFDLAVAFEWLPAGTLAPDTWVYEDEWNGCYFTNDAQNVSDADAKALAAALYRASSAVVNRKRGGDEELPALNNDQARALMRYIDKFFQNSDPYNHIYNLPVCQIVELADFADNGRFWISSPC